MHMSLYMCAFAQVYCTSSVARRAARGSCSTRQVSLQPSKGAKGPGMGTDLTDEGCSPTLPEQGQKSRSGDSDQGQPDKSTGMRQVQGKAGKSGQGVEVTKVQVLSLQYGLPGRIKDVR